LLGWGLGGGLGVSHLPAGDYSAPSTCLPSGGICRAHMGRKLFKTILNSNFTPSRLIL
jgi:hypothetical protein